MMRRLIICQMKEVEIRETMVKRLLYYEYGRIVFRRQIGTYLPAFGSDIKCEMHIQP